MHVVCFFSDTDLVNEKKRPKNKVFLCLSFIPLTLKSFIVAAERQRGSTLFLTTPANRLATCATYVSSRISISVIRCGCRFSGGEAVSKTRGINEK